MSDTQNQPPQQTTTEPVAGAEELLTEDPNDAATQPLQQPEEQEQLSEFEDMFQKANQLLNRRYDIIVPTTQEEMVFINNVIEQNDNVRKMLNIEREKQRKYEMQGYAYPLKPEIVDMLTEMERVSNEYEQRAQQYLDRQRQEKEEADRKRAEEIKANPDATNNLVEIPRTPLPPVNLETSATEEAEAEEATGPQNTADEMAPSEGANIDSGQPANPNNPEGQTVEEQKEGQAPQVVEVDTQGSGASDGSGGHQTPATGQAQAQAQPPQNTELQGKGTTTNTENVQNLAEGGQDSVVAPA